VQTYPVLSVLFAPAVVLASALFVHISTRAFLALFRALRRPTDGRGQRPSQPPSSSTSTRAVPRASSTSTRAVPRASNPRIA
jgi:hypothetical protein